MRVFGTLIVVVLLIAALYFFVVYSGVYSVAARPEGGGLLAWTLDRTADHSVERHAANIKVPNLDDPALIAEGAEEYREACAQCHGAPGKDAEKFTQGMDPPPPHYDEIAKEISPANMFWVAKNGIQMTGMPAFRVTESDRTLWGVVALIKKMPNMSPADYEKLTKE